MKLPSHLAIVCLYRSIYIPVIAIAFHHPFRETIVGTSRHFNRRINVPKAIDNFDLSCDTQGGNNVNHSEHPTFASSINTNQNKLSPLAGVPIGPVLVSQYDSSEFKINQNEAKHNESVIIRYIYEGGHPAQGRLCHFRHDSSVITISQLISKLIQDGVDMDIFYACAYESISSSGGWMPLEDGKRWVNPFDVQGNWKEAGCNPGMIFPLFVEGTSRRIDIKLFRRPMMPKLNDVDASNQNPFVEVISKESQAIEHSFDALQAIQSAVPAGKLPIERGYFGIGIIQPKTSSNVGTLLRSAFQLGASVLYTIGGRYKPNSTDTLNVPARIPLIEVNDWNAFVESSPRSAVWVVVEMGGTPLSDFQHPRNAIYILGSEDHGVPKNVLRACREVVSLEAEEYASYNVAVAGSIVMYDRMVKMRKSKTNTGKLV